MKSKYGLVRMSLPFHCHFLSFIINLPGILTMLTRMKLNFSLGRTRADTKGDPVSVLEVCSGVRLCLVNTVLHVLYKSQDSAVPPLPPTSSIQAPPISASQSLRSMNS